MATNKVVFGNHQTMWGFIEQAAWDTYEGDTGVYEVFDGPIPTGIDYGIFKDQNIRSGRGRIASSTDTYHSPLGGTRVIPFSDVIVRKTMVSDLLYASLQNVAEGASTPWEKTYTINHATTQPNFNGSAGYFASLGIKDVIASYHRSFTNCILRTLTLSADMTGGDGRLKAAGEWISGYNATTTSNFNTGAWSQGEKVFFNFNAPTKYSVGSDAVIYAFDLTINNNAVRVGHGTTGEAETYALGPYEISGNVSVKYDVNMQGVIAAAIAGTATSIQIACGTDGADGNLDFLMATCQLQDVAKDFGSPEGQRINIPFIALGVSGDGTPALVVTNSDDTADREW